MVATWQIRDMIKGMYLKGVGTLLHVVERLAYEDQPLYVIKTEAANYMEQLVKITEDSKQQISYVGIGISARQVISHISYSFDQLRHKVRKCTTVESVLCVLKEWCNDVLWDDACQPI